MKYDLLYDRFLECFPEDADALNARAEELSLNPSDGMHLMFGMVIVPFLLKLIEEKDDVRLRRAFHFFEQMETSGNALICEVLEFTVLEELIAQGESVLNYCKSYMERETLKGCQNVERYMM